MRNSSMKLFVKVMKLGGKRLLPFFVGIILLNVCWTLVTICTAYISKFIIDGIGANDLELIKKGLLTGVFGLLVITFILPVSKYLYCYHSHQILAHVRRMLFKHRSALTVSYYENSHSGDFISKLLYDTTKMCAIFTDNLKMIIEPVLSILILLGPMLLLDWRITIFMFLLDSFFLYMNTRFSEAIRDRSAAQSKALGILVEKFINLLAGVSVIKMFPIKEPVITEFEHANKDYTGKANKVGNISSALETLCYSFEFLGTLVFLLVGGILVNRQFTTYGVLIGMVSFQTSLIWLFLKLGYSYTDIHSGLASAERLFEFLDEQPEKEFYEMPHFDSESTVEMKNVSFSYSADRKILDNFSLRVENGEKVALVGLSGSGKSTVAKLLLGFYAPESGSISIMGKDYSQRSMNDIRTLIAYVSQEPYMYDVSLAENIRMGALTATDEEIVNAAKAANAHEFIMAQPDGYQTIAGERGSLLSGGQRQRIAIARAILKNAPILILDEATSALDNESEKLVREAIARLSKDRTTIIIAHRPSTIESADRIVRCGEAASV